MYQNIFAQFNVINGSVLISSHVICSILPTKRMHYHFSIVHNIPSLTVSLYQTFLYSLFLILYVKIYILYTIKTIISLYIKKIYYIYLDVYIFLFLSNNEHKLIINHHLSNISGYSNQEESLYFHHLGYNF